MSSSASTSRVFALLVRRPGHSVETISLSRFPFLIGRHPDADLRLEIPGIWDRHLLLELDPREGVVARAQNQAISLVEGREIDAHRLRQGEEVRVGPVTLELMLAAAPRKSLYAPEAFVWLLTLGMTAAELLLLWRLGW